MLKMAELGPMPSASVAMKAHENPGACLSTRAATRRSDQRPLMGFPPRKQHLWCKSKANANGRGAGVGSGPRAGWVSDCGTRRPRDEQTGRVAARKGCQQATVDKKQSRGRDFGRGTPMTIDRRALFRAIVG